MKNTKGTINEIKQQLQSDELTAGEIERLRQDERTGVQKLIQQYDQKLEKERQLKDQYERMKVYEYQLKSKGYFSVAGIDEVGRGPLAGPVVAASVILDPRDESLIGINDSKKLSELKRNQFYETILKHARAVGIGIVDSQTIDEINIYEASKKAMKLAIEDMNVNADFYLLDAMKLEGLQAPQQSLIKGDQKSVSIAAGSVVAKVTRDRLMVEAAKDYPAFEFDRNMGYGTANHLKALEQHGPTPFHRMSFNPVSLYKI
ncbi:ribonuclease HII [Alkalibacillus filiformis]|uniref:Ribonuclease HII n=1 Tax=Alkalibacillus filiformis TaxID=200990 RepID=A0ABU0DQJ6_9BACI|nr:ribonuclease HII [Alkalibacillus filiformis]MDQ0350604.1 ribonuclease HII [Alkalibacillus filiformis]